MKEGEELALGCDLITNENPYYAQHVARAKADGLEFPQYRISGVMGHFGGSLDGIARLPERYGIDEPVLLERRLGIPTIPHFRRYGALRRVA
ncbi:hypothetical protein PSV3_00028 [Septimatrevirus PSV31]|uniref:Uncharacterized protein n=1 Tax=Pseudomonas phage PSV3 TaxID=3003632 RepID=A0AAE9VVX7_9CAUD|nr:Cas4-domain exonuclease [Pseudomonas phage PSV3]WBF76730.1 hypothetical protein PSV3_00028 [Pseudomonas phage PSV3]